MERILHKASSHEEADEWDLKQQISMTPQERIQAVRELQRRFYPQPTKDVREWVKTR